MRVPYCQMVRRAALVNVLIGFLMAVLTPATAESRRPVRIVAFGDSLTAGYEVPLSDAFPAQLERLLRQRGLEVEIANAGVSGDTTAAGLARVAWAVPEGTDAVILELGANDALRGLPPDRAKANLDAILGQLKARGVEVLLAGMRAPRNLGNDYANAFDRMYRELADTHGIALYPFFLAGVALDPKLNLRDGLHPNAEGIAVIAARIAPMVEAMMHRVLARRVEARPRG